MKKPMESGQFKLDERETADIRRQIARLAGAYTPEWHFDEKNPDIGSTLALLFAEQTETVSNTISLSSPEADSLIPFFRYVPPNAS